MRIFPDKLSPGDNEPEKRRRVKLVGTVGPPIADVTVYFKVFDVDDPFDQVNNTMPDVALIDANMASLDNRVPAFRSAFCDPKLPQIGDWQSAIRNPS